MLPTSKPAAATFSCDDGCPNAAHQSTIVGKQTQARERQRCRMHMGCNRENKHRCNRNAIHCKNMPMPRDGWGSFSACSSDSEIHCTLHIFWATNVYSRAHSQTHADMNHTYTYINTTKKMGMNAMEWSVDEDGSVDCSDNDAVSTLVRLATFTRAIGMRLLLTWIQHWLPLPPAQHRIPAPARRLTHPAPAPVPRSSCPVQTSACRSSCQAPAPATATAR